MENFEQFLKEKHSETYMGTDDNMSDDFELWLTELGVDELIEYADKFEQAVREETIKTCLDIVFAETYPFDGKVVRVFDDPNVAYKIIKNLLKN